jgi:hypothetical protein
MKKRDLKKSCAAESLKNGFIFEVSFSSVHHKNLPQIQTDVQK